MLWGITELPASTLQSPQQLGFCATASLFAVFLNYLGRTSCNQEMSWRALNASWAAVPGSFPNKSCARPVQVDFEQGSGRTPGEFGGRLKYQCTTACQHGWSAVHASSAVMYSHNTHAAGPFSGSPRAEGKRPVPMPQGAPPPLEGCRQFPERRMETLCEIQHMLTTYYRHYDSRILLQLDDFYIKILHISMPSISHALTGTSCLKAHHVYSVEITKIGKI